MRAFAGCLFRPHSIERWLLIDLVEGHWGDAGRQNKGVGICFGRESGVYT